MKKMMYGAPELEVIEMQIEQGFAATNPGETDGDIEDGTGGGYV